MDGADFEKESNVTAFYEGSYTASMILTFRISVSSGDSLFAVSIFRFRDFLGRSQAPHCSDWEILTKLTC